MQSETNTKAEIIALLEGRPQVSLEKIRQFILDLDELDYREFLYPADHDYAEELDERAAEAKGILENLRDMRQLFAAWIEARSESSDQGRRKAAEPNCT